MSSLIDKMALTMALYISSKDVKNSTAVMKFALSVILNVFFIVFFSLVIGILTHRVLDTFIALIAIAALRRYTGGHHINSNDLCVIISVGIVSAAVYTPITLGMNYALIILSTVLISVFAPYNLINQDKGDLRYLRNIGWICAVIVGLNLFIVSSILTKSFFIQAVTLIHKKRGGIEP